MQEHDRRALALGTGVGSRLVIELQIDRGQIEDLPPGKVDPGGLRLGVGDDGVDRQQCRQRHKAGDQELPAPPHVR